MTRYASQTSVSVERSRAEIERTLVRYGAEQFIYGWDGGSAVIGFVVTTESGRRHVRFTLPLPRRDDLEFTHHSRGRRSASEIERKWEQACRQRWRALNLVVKAKLEAVESGIASFEDEFLAYIAIPGGGTVGDLMRPQLAEAYESNRIPGGLLLQLGKGDDE